jgi:His-Xaa-Ser system protein HxsD
MKLKVSETDRTVDFSVDRKVYSRDAAAIAAQILAKNVNVYLDESKTKLDLTLEAKRKDLKKADLENLAGEFLNEMLNQEYRFVVGRFNQKIANLIVTQSLLAARGGEEPKKAPEPETPEFKAEVARLIKEAQDEIKRTMPKKLPPQGNPLPPEKE